MRPRLIVGGLTVLAIGLALWWWFDTFEYVPGEATPAERGPASYNAFYALERGLNAAGFDATSIANLVADQPLPKGGTVVLYADPSTIDAATTTRLLAFVHDGGHLIISAPHPARAKGPLLDVLGLTPAADAAFYPRECAVPMLVPPPGTEPPAPAVAACFEDWLSARFDVAIARADRGWIGRMHRGEGSVSVADLDLIANRELRATAHDDLVWWLLAPNLSEPAGAVLLVYSLESESLAALILRHAWQPALGALLVLLAFLWLRMLRFGPLLPSPGLPRRALLEHVLASARFAWNLGEREALKTAVMQQVLVRARLPLDALDEPAIANLAASSGFDRATVRGVLRGPAPRETKGFIEHIATMLKLRRSI